MIVWRRRERAATAVLILGMVAVTAIFLASTLYNRRRADMTEQALSVSANAGPSLRLLSDARTELRRVRRAGAALVLESDPHAVQDMQQARHRLGGALFAELATPEYPEEREQARLTMAAVGALDRAVGRLTAQDPPSTARYLELESAAETLDRRLDALHDLNAHFLQRDANQLLEHQRRLSARIYWIDIVDVLLAAALTFALIRFIRRHLALAERRSRELEFFAIQVAHDIFNPILPIQVTLETCEALAPNQRAEQAIARSRRSLERLRRAADELLAFAHAGVPPRADDQASPRACLAAIAGCIEPEGRVSVEAIDDRPVHAGVEALDAVMRAFLREAAREADPADPVEVLLLPADGRVRIELRIPRRPDAPLPRAPELFSPRIRGPRSGAPGIQLDLAAAREIVEAHGGRLGVTENGARRTLWFELPSAA